MTAIHSYPEPDACSLTRQIAVKNNIAPKNVCMTNGATEAIYLIAQAFRQSRTAILIPTFSEYEDACRIHQHQLSFYPDLESVPKEMQLVWLCNPNNPTGKVWDKKTVEQSIRKHPDTVFVIDQSYESFTEKEVLSSEEAIAYKNVILVYSLTKQYMISGLRIGYLTADTALLKSVSSYRMPWSVNALAIEAGNFLLNHPVETLNLSGYLAETKCLQKALSLIENLEVFPTDTHFFLCKWANGRTAFDLKNRLINRYGILIRDAANFRGLDDSYFRIATQSEEENNQLIKAIAAWK
jgi:threonine-phosphate decarboxylase